MTRAQIKQLAPLRSSDRRKIADQILDDLDLLPDVPGDASEEQKAAVAQTRTTLREKILPENAMSAKFSTTHGPDLKPVNGTVYVGSYKDDDQRVLWFKIYDQIYPSVYMLWRYPGIVPVVHTIPPVIRKMQTGADLMAPGLALGPPFDRRAKKDAYVGVADMEEVSVPLIVGTAEINISDLQQVQGVKGHAVRTMHWVGDGLWAWSPIGKPGVDPPDKLEPVEVGGNDAAKDENDSQIASKMDDMTVESEDGDGGGVGLPSESEQSTKKRKAAGDDGDEPDQEDREMTTKEIDDAFRNAFLYGVHQYKGRNQGQQNYGFDFPLQQSWVLSNMVQPFLPAFTPHQANQLQIKKTSHKSIKKFIRALDKEQIVKSKERGGNEVVIFDIDFEDAAIKAFVPYRLPKKENSASADSSRGNKAGEAAGSSGDGSSGQKLKIFALYKPREKLSPLFEASKASVHGLYSISELGTITSTYIEFENLVKEANKRLVDLNPFLANTVFGADSALDKEVITRGRCQRDTLNSRVVANCAPYYHIVQNNDKSSAKPKAGLPPKISIVLETRSGNKTVTKVSGLEPFFVQPQPLADELRKACAGSTSVEKLQGSSAKNPVMEVMIQGPQRDAVVKALEKRGVDKKWIDVQDKTKSKKKG